MATGQQAIDRALSDLNDTAGNTWSTSFMLDRLNDGLAEVVRWVPSAYAVHTQLTLTINESRQVVPSTIVRVLDITRNMGADGATLGRSVTLLKRSELDAIDRNWHRAPVADEIDHWTYDEETPGFFYVWRRPRVAVKVDAIVSQVPAITLASNTLPISDIYFNALVTYLRFRAFKRAGRKYDPAKATAEYQEFMQILGVSDRANKAQAAAQRTTRK